MCVIIGFGFVFILCFLIVMGCGKVVVDVF